MAVSPIPTYEPGLTTVSPSAGPILEANPTSFYPPPPPPQSQPNVGSSNGAMQPNTIIGVVIGLVLFAALILAFCFISRLPCFRQTKSDPLTLTRSRSRPWTHMDAPNYDPEDIPLSSLNAGRDPYNHNHHMNGPCPRPRPSIQHVEQPIATYTETPNGRIRCDHNTSFLPPYEGPSPPLYSQALQHPPQHLHSPPRAVVEA